MSFDVFMSVKDSWRRHTVAEQRRRAGFSDEQFNFIRKKFDERCKKNGTSLDKGDLFWLLMDFGLPLGTTKERHDVLTLLDTARATARDAGVVENSLQKSDTLRVTFWDLVHL